MQRGTVQTVVFFRLEGFGFKGLGFRGFGFRGVGFRSFRVF